MGKKDDKKGTGTPSEATKHVQNTILEMRRDGTSFIQIAKSLGYSDTYVKKLYRMALKSIIVEKVEDVRKLEMAKLDRLEQEVVAVLKSFHVVISNGEVVRDLLLDDNGNPILGDDGQPIRQRIKDDMPVLAAVDRALKIMARRARLLGLDAPQKIAPTTPDGKSGIPCMIAATPLDEAL
jgi:hypothetical protein